MLNANGTPILALLFLLTACSGVDSKPGTPVTTQSASIVDQFENRLAEKLLHQAFLEISPAHGQERFEATDRHRQKLDRSVDLTKLTARNQLHLRLFKYLWHREQQKSQLSQTGHSPSYSEKLELESSTLDAANFLIQAENRLATLHANIRVLTNTPKETSLRQLFVTTRDNPENYLPNTDAGRQRYLDLIVDALLRVEKLLPTFYLVAQEEFTVEGFENKEDPLLFYDKDTRVLKINLEDMGKLPLYDVENIAFYYGVPGMHSINARPLLEFQTMVTNDATIEGWAAYITAILGRLLPSPRFDAAHAYFEAMSISLAIADVSLNTRGWSIAQAEDFVTTNSPYPISRLRNSIRVARQSPGIFAMPLLVRMQYEQLQQQAESEFKDGFVDREFHYLLLVDGPLPFPELQRAVNKWLEAKTRSR